VSTLLSIFGHNLLPIFLTAASGYLAANYLGITPRSLSQVAFYIFSPCLIFTALTTSKLDNADIVRMAVFTLVNLLSIGVITWIAGRVLQLERGILVAVLLTTMFTNAGNYGLSLNLFAFGEIALAHATVFFVVNAILMYTLGAIIASLGSSNLKQAVLSVFKVPAVYAVAIALIFNKMAWKFPVPLDQTITLLGNAAIPILMVLMGVQMKYAKWNGHTRALTLSTIIRLGIGPILAIVLSLVFGLQGAARQAGITEAAMPAAVLNTILATEYNVEPGFVSTVVFISTILSPLTITPLLAFLGA
jgi:predicted permease